MQVNTNDSFACYRSDYQRCVNTQNTSSVPALDDAQWIYPNYIAPQSAFGRAQLPSMYTQQRHPDQSYPSPSPSVPSPGPRGSPQLDLSAHASAALAGYSNDPSCQSFVSRDASLGPVRNLRNRQVTMSYKPSKRTSISDPQLSLDTPESRPGTPLDEYSPAHGLSLNTDALSPYQPATPASLCSPYLPYNEQIGRPPSPTLTSRSYSDSGPNSPSTSYFPDVSSGSYNRGAVPPPRMKKHTKKKLDSVEKKRICLYHIDHQNARQEDIAEMFGIERSTVSKILKNKNQWLNVDDNAETHAKNRPSKFPELEEVMRKFLQDCTDKDTPITDSLIRNRALEVAKTLFITEDKFKASSGWVENFKHRHGIRSGKWTSGVKNVPASHNPNPGLNGTTSGLSYHHQPMAASSSASMMRSNRYASPELELDGDMHDEGGDHDHRGQQIHSSEDKQDSQWSAPTHRMLSLSTAPVLPSPLSASSSDSSGGMQQDGGIDNGSMQGQATSYLQPDPLVYAPHQSMRGPPSIQEAEEAINTVIAFIDSSAHQIINQQERQTLTTIKYALFQYASGVPFDRR